MKKLFVLLVCFSFLACNYFDSKSVVGEYDGKVQDNVFKLKLTDTKEYVFFNDALCLHTGTYIVNNSCVYLNEGNGMVDTLRIINKNTLQLFQTNNNALNLYRLGSPEEVKHFSDSAPAVKTQSNSSVKQSSNPPQTLINQLKVTPPIVKRPDTVVSDTGGE